MRRGRSTRPRFSLPIWSGNALSIVCCRRRMPGRSQRGRASGWNVAAVGFVLLLFSVLATVAQSLVLPDLLGDSFLVLVFVWASEWWVWRSECFDEAFEGEVVAD